MVFKRELRTGSRHSFADSKERENAVAALDGWNEVRRWAVLGIRAAEVDTVGCDFTDDIIVSPSSISPQGRSSAHSIRVGVKRGPIAGCGLVVGAWGFD